MANHEGYSLGIDVDFSQLEKANKATGALYQALAKVNQRFSGMHMPNGLPSEINHVNAVTASYIQRLESEGRTHQANQERIKGYGDAVEKLNRKLKSQEDELAKIALSSGKTSSAYQKQQIRINQTATAVNNLNDKINNLHPTGFNRLISTTKKLDNATETVKSKLHSAWDNIKGGATVAASAVGAVTAATIHGAKKAGDLQQTYKEINNLATLGGEKQKAVTKSVMQMQAQGRDMSIKYGKSQQDIAAGFEDLVKRGYTTRQALGAMQTELQASVASGDKFSDVTTVASQVIDSFGLRANSTAKMIRNTNTAVNELAYSADATSTGFSTIGIGMSYVGAAAKALNISLAETASSMGILSNNGLESDKAGTGLRSVINGIGNQLNLIGTKKSVFDPLGIKKSDLVNARGQLKPLSHDLSVIYRQIKAHSKDTPQSNGFFKSIFGTTGQQAAIILAKNTKELSSLTKRTREAGSSGNYVAKLAAKNGQTAKMQVAKAKQAISAFQIEMGVKFLPVINKAGNKLAKFLTTKNGKKFEKNVAGAIGKVADALIKLMNWSAEHTGALKGIGEAVLAGYSISKGIKFINFLADTRESLLKINAVRGLLGADTGAGALTGMLQSTHAAGGFKNLSTAGKVGTAAAGAGVAIDTGVSFFNAFKNRHSADKRSEDIGKGIGSGIGGGIGLWFGGPLGAAVGAKIGGIVGKWGGQAVNKFTKGWQSKKPPKSKLSLENLGWSAHSMWNGFSSSVGKAISDAKKQFASFGKWLGQSWNGTQRNVGNFFGKVGKGIGSGAKYIASGKIGSDIHSSWKKAIGVSHNFFRKLPKQFDNFKKNINKTWNETWKNVNNNRYVKAFKKGQLIKTGLSDIEKRTRGFRQSFGKNWNGTLNSAKHNLGAFRTDTVKKWNSIWSTINSSRYVKAFKRGKFFQTILDDISSQFDTFKKSFLEKWNSFWDEVNNKINSFKNWSGKKWSSAKKSISSNAKSAANNVIGGINDVNYAFGGNGKVLGYVGSKKKAHATGGHIGSSHGALVGEGGPELAYKVNDSHVRILGANGPEFTHVKAGERILNARDTQKVMRGGLGAGLVLNGYAAGNTKLNHTAKSTNQTWKKITFETGKQTKKTRVQSIRDYTNMRKGVNKQMDGLHDGTVSLAKSTAKGFGKAMGRMKGYAKDAMKDTIGQINRGISGIDKVLGQFGGNNSVIKPVKFATGSNGQLNNNTLAMVNDAQSGPRQEAIVKASGDIWLPHGDNRILPLQKGDAVLNGMQTQDLAHSWGLTHFAKGSGVSTSMLKKIASRGAANPAKSFSDMFLSKLKSGKVDITAGTVDLAKNSGKQFGVPWMNAMWTVIGDAIGDGAGRGGTREAFLKYAESTFSGVRYVMGAASKTASDCSGMVMQALRRFNVNIGRSTVDMQNSSGAEYLGKSLSKTVPGDLVIFGHGSGAAGHVGIIKNPQKGTMFNETPPSARVSRISDDKSMGYGYYRVKGLHDATAKSSNKKPSSALLSLAKRELGASAIKWIKDKLGDEGELGPNIGGEGVRRWAGTVKRILWMLHLSTSQGMVAKVLRQIQTESGGNPHAIQPGADPDGDGSGPAMGLMQTKKATFNAFKRKGAGKIFNGPDNIYAALNYAKHKYGDNLSALGNGHGYANGGNPPVGENVLVGEKGPEIARFKNPVHVYSHEQSKRMSLDNLINKSKIKMPKTGANVPNVTININGNISSERDAKKYAEIIDRKIQDLFESIGLEFGSDPSMY